MSAPTIRFPDFNEPWRNTSLGDECSFSKGKGISKADIDPDGATPCVRYGQLYTDYGTVIGDAISRTSVDQSLLRISEGGEVIIPASGEDSKDIATAAVVINKGVALGGDLNILTSDHDGHFLAEYLSGKKRMDLAVLAQGNSVVHLYPKQLSGVAIALPSLPEQRRIADALSAVDAKIDLLVRKRDNLTRFKAGLMQKIFSQEVRFTREDGSAYPDWKEKKLEEISILLRGKNLSKSDLDPDGVNPAIHYGQLFTEYTEVSLDVKSRTNVDGIRSNSGDILMPTSDVTPNGLGCATAFFVDGAVIGGDINIIRPSESVDSAYLSYWISAHKYKFIEKVTGTTVKHIYLKDIKPIEVLLPSLEEQSEIAKSLMSIDGRISFTERQIENMQSFKKGLLQQMFV